MFFRYCKACNCWLTLVMLWFHWNSNILFPRADTLVAAILSNVNYSQSTLFRQICEKHFTKNKTYLKNSLLGPPWSSPNSPLNLTYKRQLKSKNGRLIARKALLSTHLREIIISCWQLVLMDICRSFSKSLIPIEDESWMKLKKLQHIIIMINTK